MKVMEQPIGVMYLWAIALLSAIAIFSSYELGEFPYALVLSVLIAALIEILIRRFYQRQRFKIPISGLITGLIVGSVAPISAPLLLVSIAITIAVLSKFFIRYKGGNIFNPAAIGLVVALAIFGAGDEWWAAGNYNIYGLAVTLTPILIILAYESRRLTMALSFVSADLLLMIATGALVHVSVDSIVGLLFGVNYYFAFVMLVEPKTSPYGKYAQIAYGASAAGFYLGLSFLRIQYPLLITLLMVNILYFIYRRSRKR